MDFVTSHFGKMKLWRVEHFYNIFVLTLGRDCYCITLVCNVIEREIKREKVQMKPTII